MGRDCNVVQIDRDAALYFSYLEVMNFYLSNIHGGLQPKDFDESEPIIGGKYHTLQIFFDTMCNTASKALSDKCSCELVLDNDWRTDRINERDSIEKFIVKLAEKLVSAPPRSSGQIALGWVANTTVA